MSHNSDINYKSFFWKRFFILFALFFVIGIISEPYITKNPFTTLEDYGEFVFFLLFYIFVITGLSAFVVSFAWRLKQSKK